MHNSSKEQARAFHSHKDLTLRRPPTLLSSVAMASASSSILEGNDSPDLFIDSLIGHLNDADRAGEDPVGIDDDNDDDDDDEPATTNSAMTDDQDWNAAIAAQQQHERNQMNQKEPEPEQATFHDSIVSHSTTNEAVAPMYQHHHNTATAQIQPAASIAMGMSRRFEIMDTKYSLSPQPAHSDNDDTVMEEEEDSHARCSSADEEEDDDDDDLEWQHDSRKPSATRRRTSKRRNGIKSAVAAGNSSSVTPTTTLSSVTKRKRVRKKYEPDVRTYFDFTDQDVLCHRGGFANKHPGNLRYHQVKMNLQPAYEATAKSQKRNITQQLVDAVHAWGGRFLEQDANSERWFEIHPKKALTKASQALRENYTSEERAAKRARYRLRKEGEEADEEIYEV